MCAVLLDDDATAADAEGTVIAVVDFASALIALPAFHTDSNDALWLEPATAHIPPESTRCTLLLRPGPFRLRLDRMGRCWYASGPTTLSETARNLQAYLDTRPDGRLRITIETGTAQIVVLRQRITQVGDAVAPGAGRR